MEKVKRHTACRLCAGPLEEIYDYGDLPLANGLCSTAEEAVNAERFEQKLMFCPSCLLGQLSVVVAPEILWKDYVYQSSVSPVFQAHCRGLADVIQSHRPSSVLDIAGNDGALAREITKISPMRVFVVDPAAPDSENPEPWEKTRALWNEKTALSFRERHGHMDVITAQNVIGHVDDIKGFFRAVKYALSTHGLFIVEIPSFVELIKQGAFDTVYHEHVSYWTAAALYRLARETGFRVESVELLPVHCGSFRVVMIPGNPYHYGGIPYETEFFGGGALDSFAALIDNKINLLRDVLTAAGWLTVGITASAKSSVMLNLLGDMDGFPRAAGLLDDGPLKQGKFSPGTGIEIAPFSSEILEGADVALILSRNLHGQLVEKIKALGFRGTVIGV